MNPLGKTLATIMAQPSNPLTFLSMKPKYPRLLARLPGFENPANSTFLRLLARVRLAVAPPAKGGSGEGVQEMDLATQCNIECLAEGSMRPAEIRQLFSLPPKEACQHTRRTRSGRCFHCGEV